VWPAGFSFYIMKIYGFTFNPFQENTWLVYHSQGSCIIVDPGCMGAREQMALSQFIADQKLTVIAVVNTHAHLDHVAGWAYARQQWKVPFYLHEKEKPVLERAMSSGLLWGIEIEDPGQPDIWLKNEDVLPLPEFPLEIRFTPGHSPGSICLISHAGRWVIAGDVLFKGSIGRTDLPGGDTETLLASVRRQLFTLPDDYTVCSGHGETTGIGHEKRFNPFFLQA
jgi:glyoxylase-like metal-dependent hydrolase (beta-lactamase superfamily II)